MDISSLVGGTPTYGQKPTKNGEVNQQDFLNLLTTQLKNQNPLEPAKDSEFLGQLASFSALEENKSQTAAIQQLASSIAANTGLQSLSQAAGLIGKHIKYYDQHDNIIGADVLGVEFNEAGLQLATSDGKLVSLGLIASISDEAVTADDIENNNEQDENTGV